MFSTSISKSNRLLKVILGLCLLLIGATFILGKTSFIKIGSNNVSASEPIQISGFDQTEYDDAKLPDRVIVPSVSIDLSVKKAEIIDGYWQVFDDSAAWGAGSAVPSEVGNQVIFAHARKGLFLPLKNVKVGDTIYILTKEEYFKYKVDQLKEVYPSQIEVISPTEDETLTLYTCSGYRDSKRLIVVAKRLL
jgi:LPXTG-site transpeptidase (sortase) family protein